ncbi:MAG TPA: LysR family transcriptional regulator [Jiangellaceae bacterium]|nr:LysR family transcriptional regulator [Jiangellaceae bacterium]
MHLDPRRLMVLRAVARAGGVLAAAPGLHLTPSAVSQHIMKLEAETGLTLLDRSQLGGRRAAGLTDAGRQLALHADRLAEVLAAAEADLSALTGQVGGPVTIGAFPTSIRHLVVPALHAVMSTAPAVQVRVRQLERKPGRLALRAGELDLLITESKLGERPASSNDLRAIRLLDDPYLVAVPVDWPIESGVESLLDRPWIDGPADSAMRRVLDHLEARYGATVNRVHECLEFPPALDLVSAGLAAAIVPTLAVIDEHPRIRIIKDAAVGARQIDIEFRRGRYEPNPAARTVVAAIRSVAARRAAESG